MFIFSLYHTAFILSTRIISVMMPKPVNYKSASSASKELPDIFIYLATYLLRPIFISPRMAYFCPRSSDTYHCVHKNECIKKPISAPALPEQVKKEACKDDARLSHNTANCQALNIHNSVCGLGARTASFPPVHRKEGSRGRKGVRPRPESRVSSGSVQPAHKANGEGNSFVT